MYDAPAKHAEVTPVAPSSPSEITLRNGTAIHLKLGKTISSATAHVGDIVDLTVVEEVMVDGISVIPAGSAAIGLVSEAEPKKRMATGEAGFQRELRASEGRRKGDGAVLPRDYWFK